MQALYRLYRPQTFSDLVGQEHVSKVLLQALQATKISHAYLFIGPRGTGKTSTARILAKAVNCEGVKDKKFGEPCNRCGSCIAITNGSYLDLLEIDAASNRGIDEIRDLREKIKLAPTQGRFKVYIIDEVHMLTNEAFNALLKTLEEPPAHAIFILCTTDPHKIPATIKSRCQVFEFKVPSLTEITKVLEKVAKEEKAKYKKDDLTQIAQRARGAYRDALVLMEKYLLTGQLEKEVAISSLAALVIRDQTKEALTLISEGVQAGLNPKVMTESLIDYLRALLMVKLGLTETVQKEVTPDALETLQALATDADLSKIKRLLQNLVTSLEQFKWTPVPALPLELALVETDSVSPTPTIKPATQKAEPPAPVVKTPPPDQKQEAAPSVIPETTVVSVSELAVPSAELELIKAHWLDLLQKLRPINFSIEALLRSSEPVAYEGGKLTLKFFYRFHKERVEEPKNRSVIEKVIQDNTGLPVILKLVLSDTPKPKSVREATTEEVANVKIVSDGDLGDAALDIFTN